jgi:hypothetical protein
MNGVEPRPLYRSLAFCSGVFTMIRIYRASWDPIKNITRAIHGPCGAYRQVKVLVPANFSPVWQ